MNNKGQVLVIFVILLPVLLLIFAFVVDYGIISIEKRKINNNVYDATKFYLDNIDDEDVYNKTLNLLNSNLEKVKISINNYDKYVEIKVVKEYKNLFNNSIDVIYRGFKENKEIIKG